MITNKWEPKDCPRKERKDEEQQKILIYEDVSL
jgi:hypothetical protein